MARDGFFHEDIRHLMRQAAARAADGRHHSRPVIPRTIQHRCESTLDAFREPVQLMTSPS
jgi:hypothetical protein